MITQGTMLDRLRQESPPNRYLEVARRHGFEEEFREEVQRHGTAGLADYVIVKLDGILFIEQMRREAAANDVQAAQKLIEEVLSERGAK